ncbi:hypothetical protein [Nocardia carnea]|uniref:hypothetical protein n=1 Tax=Nocardia carnea TaxID=37328 RepID=UPI003D77DFEA
MLRSALITRDDLVEARERQVDGLTGATGAVQDRTGLVRCQRFQCGELGIEQRGGDEMLASLRYSLQ